MHRLKFPPYLTSETVTELSAMLVERITCKGESKSRKRRTSITEVKKTSQVHKMCCWLCLWLKIKKQMKNMSKIMFLPSWSHELVSKRRHFAPPVSRWSEADKPAICNENIFSSQTERLCVLYPFTAPGRSLLVMDGVVNEASGASRPAARSWQQAKK